MSASILWSKIRIRSTCGLSSRPRNRRSHPSAVTAEDKELITLGGGSGAAREGVFADALARCEDRAPTERILIQQKLPSQPVCEPISATWPRRMRITRSRSVPWAYIFR